MSFTYGRPPPKIEGMVSLKVDNLTYRTTPDDLRRVFEKYGDVGDVYIPRDRWTRESRGFAFVRFYDRRDAEDAMESLDGRVLDGRELRVQMASRYGRPQSPHGRSSRRRSGSRDRDRGRRRRSRSGDRGGGRGGGGGGELVAAAAVIEESVLLGDHAPGQLLKEKLIAIGPDHALFRPKDLREIPRIEEEENEKDA
ncbi:Serine/arginine-rich splicing factor 2 [Orchesella cincta]|uniref:Serine/arginine-rich splicing factor 2 n=1 Tax=Orchesella cincta TaxID=48709 RepID=A0A1D2N9V8_ORCCI|nr:Serine/arginine-rich splicing factor 2 [Orchesella cincta]